MNSPNQILAGSRLTHLRRRARAEMHCLRRVATPVFVAVVALLPAAAQAQAIEAWVQRYDGPENRHDFVKSVAVEANGDVVATGTSYGSDGNGDYVTIKYSSAGMPLWTNRYNGLGNGHDNAGAIAMDVAGNVFVTGFSRGTSGTSEYTTVKYSSAGLPLWTNRYSGGSGGLAAAVDTNGNVVVTGLSGTGCATLKYSSVGALLWARPYAFDSPRAIAVNTSGDVAVTGYVRGSSDDYLTIKYSSAGTLLWTNRYNGTGNGTDRASAVAVDVSGNVFVTGTSYNGSSYRYVTIKYSSAGAPLWTNVYDGAGEARALSLDASGNVIVTGGNPDYATIKYSDAGVPLWTNRYLKPGNYGSTATALALDAGGNVFVTGTENPSGWPPRAADFVTIAYSRDGIPLWTNAYNGPESSMDQACAAAVDTSGNVCVAGSSRSSSSGDDMLVVKYVVPPIAIQQPFSRTNAVGTTANFTIEAAGGLPLGYQWRRQGTNLVDGGNISGVTTTNLQIANVQLADAAGYTVVVTNAYGSVTSSVAQLAVYVPPNPGRFTNLSYSPATGFSFIFRDATAGQPYRIQRSPSMAEGSWTNWQSFTYTEPTGFMDVGATGAERRFYRAVSP